MATLCAEANADPDLGDSLALIPDLLSVLAAAGQANLLAMLSSTPTPWMDAVDTPLTLRWLRLRVISRACGSTDSRQRLRGAGARWPLPSGNAPGRKGTAAGEDRAHDLRIMRPTRYQLRYCRSWCAHLQHIWKATWIFDRSRPRLGSTFVG